MKNAVLVMFAVAMFAGGMTTGIALAGRRAPPPATVETPPCCYLPGKGVTVCAREGQLLAPHEQSWGKQ